jgi:hypothetical protein
MRILAAGILLIVLAGPPGLEAADGPLRFSTDFEGGLAGWETFGHPAVSTLGTHDPVHATVMLLRPSGDVYALVAGSADWGGVRIEGEVLFPTAEDAYLGVIYDFQRQGDRLDFGLFYIKGNDSYLMVNPHRDFNVGRTLYPEYKTPLVGPAAIEVGRWQRFAVEVVGSTCHFYVGDMETPQITFADLELDHGAVGLQPRSVGGDVWVDNVRVFSIDRLRYSGPARPRAFPYASEQLLTRWEVAGPFERTHDSLATPGGDSTGAWRDFPTDGRGAVITARITDYHGPRTVAYFRTRVHATAAREAILELSTVDDLALWVNGRFRWFVGRDPNAWYDAGSEPAHAAQHIPIPLVPGDNVLVVRVRGGVYASGGFFARID